MLVGRAAECRVVDGLVAGARLGRSGVLVVTGEAGIGKSALVEHAAAVADGMRLLRARGSEAERDVPFGGLSQLFRPTPADLDRLPGPQAHALGVALALRDGAVSDRLAVGAAVLGLLSRHAEDRPLGVLVDDAHLLDAPSAEALAFACRRLLADPVFVLVAARSEEDAVLVGAGLPGLALTGLDAAATAELARRRAGHLGAGELAALHRVTGGNPLAVRELAGRLPAVPAADDPPAPIPARLTAWFGRRVTALGADCRTLLVLAAITGGDLAVVAAAAAGRGLGLDALAEAERAGLVAVGADRVEFAHPLVRAAVYALAYPDQRRALHAAVAAALPAREADRRAWHRSAAAVGPDEEVAAEVDAAGERAGARGAHAVSATAHERAARLSPGERERAARLLRAAEAAWRAGDGGRATALLDRVEGLQLARPARAVALGLRGDVEACRGSPERAARRLVAAAGELAAADPSQAVLLLAEAVSACFYGGDAAGALAAAERAERLLGPGLSPTATAVGTLAAGMARILAGRPGAEQVRAGVRLLDAATAADAGPARPAWLMLGPLWLREAGTGRSLVRAALERGRARSAVGALPLLLFTIARDGATTEHWASAQADYAEAIALARELGHTTELAISLAGLAWLQARLGRAEDCRAHADEALALCARHPVTTARVWAEHALAERAVAAGDAAAAEDRLCGLAELLDRIGLRDPDLSPAPELVEVLVHRGEPDRAREVAGAYAVAAAAKGLPWASARAARVRGLLCGPDEVDGHFAAALALHARTPDVFEEARTRLAHGARLRRVRRRVDARVPLRAALAVFERLGARPWADAAAAELEATGETAVRGEGAGTTRLTPRELQVALLLAEGRTTRQAAAALFVSPKTVEYHLRHVYTKLGVATRAELVARLGERGGAQPAETPNR